MPACAARLPCHSGSSYCTLGTPVYCNYTSNSWIAQSLMQGMYQLYMNATVSVAMHSHSPTCLYNALHGPSAVNTPTSTTEMSNKKHMQTKRQNICKQTRKVTAAACRGFWKQRPVCALLHKSPAVVPRNYMQKHWQVSLHASKHSGSSFSTIKATWKSEHGVEALSCPKWLSRVKHSTLLIGRPPTDDNIMMYNRSSIVHVIVLANSSLHALASLLFQPLRAAKPQQTRTSTPFSMFP